jgi:hypothetical protein
MLWVLSLSKGLLRVFNARYAAFYFNRTHVILDILPIRSNRISRFALKRSNGKKPAEDLKDLILQSGQEWYDLINNRTSKSYASLCLLRKNRDKQIAPESIRPESRLRPRFSKEERNHIKRLQIEIQELLSGCQANKIKTAYKKLAKIHHPDMGGDAEKFKELSEAHEQMMAWAEDPQFTSRKALSDCWSYDGFTNRWAPPL